VSVYVRLTVTDTLGVLIDGSHAFNPLAKVTRTFWYRLPAAWVCAGRLVPSRRDHLLELLYGEDWTSGTGDGSHYIVLNVQERVLTEQEARARPWLSDRAAFYAWRDGDVLEEVIPAAL
jgi:hypothetical protein